jgi:Kdo2-lipid IVA lauroyltransferase/acyltransferase
MVERWAGYGLLRAIQAVVSLLPPAGATRLGRAFGGLIFRLSGKSRAIALRSLAMVYPEMSLAERLTMTRHVCINFATTIMEMLRLPAMRPQEIAQRYTVEGLEHLDAALLRGKGVLLLTAHFGNWEFLGLPLMGGGYPIDAIARDPELPATAAFIRRLRTGRVVNHMYPKQHTLAAMRALRENRIVLILPDQHDFNGLPITFLGHRALGAAGPASYARATGAAVVPAFGTRQPDGRIHLHFYPALPLEPTDDKRADIKRWTQQIHDVIGERVLAEPEQWEWIHDRWRPDAKPRMRS